MVAWNLVKIMTRASWISFGMAPRPHERCVPFLSLATAATYPETETRFSSFLQIDLSCSSWFEFLEIFAFAREKYTGAGADRLQYLKLHCGHDNAVITDAAAQMMLWRWCYGTDDARNQLNLPTSPVQRPCHWCCDHRQLQIKKCILNFSSRNTQVHSKRSIVYSITPFKKACRPFWTPFLTSHAFQLCNKLGDAFPLRLTEWLSRRLPNAWCNATFCLVPAHSIVQNNFGERG